jgi:predicted HAD superfamily Cof-like phosphohydrolase
MHKAQSQVREFNRDVVRGPISPAEPRLRDTALRARLIIEEAVETIVGLLGASAARNLLHEYAYRVGTDETPDLVETIDGLCDLIYVAYGAAEAIGIDLEPFFDEVHRTNMAKAGAGLDEHGKLDRTTLARWSPPRLADILEAQQRRVRGVGE